MCRAGDGALPSRSGEYSVQIGAGDSWIAFNICGNTTSLCADQPNKQQYYGRGAAIQYIEGWANDGQRYQPSTLDQVTACDVTAGKNRGCYDWGTSDGGSPAKPLLTNWQNPNPAMQGCCSDGCEILAASNHAFTLIDPNDPVNGGVRLTYAELGTE